MNEEEILNYFPTKLQRGGKGLSREEWGWWHSAKERAMALNRGDPRWWHLALSNGGMGEFVDELTCLGELLKDFVFSS